MRKRAVIALALVIALAGCQYVGIGEQQEVVGAGAEGLAVHFLEDTPPPIAYAPGKMLIMLLVENLGTYDANEGSIYLSGFDHSILQLSAPSGKIQEKASDREARATRTIGVLPGRNEYTTTGGTNIVDYKDVTLGSLSDYNVDKYSSIILATMCYKYETKAATEICLDFEPYGAAREQKICVPQNKQLGTQGAPISVPLVEVEAAQGQTHLRIHVKNAGGGTVFDEKEMDKCSPYNPEGLSYREVDMITIDDIYMLGGSIKEDCNPSKQVRLNNGEGIIYCSIKKDAKSAVGTEFVTPLSVQLSYGYRQTTMKPIEIRKAG
ncbi:hypothetical protein KY329_02845 [Candidatus Woesearchaeota archaeon]|nr:hypothetical protein [Candidatus Woesearchaeota archaeon]